MIFSRKLLGIKQLMLSYITVLMVSSVLGQEPVHYNLNDENGLPSNEVYQVLQDDFGYIWIGCDAGLFRYDGFSYKQFAHPDQNGRSISDLQLDVKGRVWSRNFNGQIYCVEKDSMILITQKLKVNLAHVLYTLDDKGSAWIILGGKIFNVSSNGTILFSKILKGLKTDLLQVHSIRYYNRKIYFSDSANGVYTFDLSKSTCEHVNKEVIGIESNTFFLFKDQLYILSELTRKKQLNIFKLEGSYCQITHGFSYTNLNPRLYALSEDKSKDLWMCTANGLIKYDQKIKLLNDENSFLKGKNVSSIFEDREGNHWVTTLQNGIYVIPDLNVVKYDMLNSNLIEQNLTIVKKINNHQILLGSHSGKVFEYNTHSRKIREYSIKNEAKTISTKFIYSRGKDVFISHGQLNKIIEGKVQNGYPLYNARDIEIVGDSLYFMLPEINGRVALGDMMDPNKYIMNKGGGRDIVFNPADGYLYFAFNSGVFAYKNGVWKEIKYKNKSIFASKLELYKNMLCIATTGNGLLFVKQTSSNKFTIEKSFNKSNSSLADELKYVCIQSNEIWVCSNSALSKINYESDEIANYTQYNGINPKDINCIEIGQHSIFLATNKGLILFPKKLDSKNYVKPTIQIKHVVHEGKAITHFQKLTLPYDKNKLKVFFSSISLKSRGTYTIYYRLVGLDSTWNVLPANSKYINFNAIPSGTFTFELKAENESGVMSEIVSFDLTIESPLWEKWWFYLLASIVAMLVLILIFNSRINYIKRRAELANKLTASQLTALKSQMNPHFIFNALNSIQDLVLHHDVKNSNLYISKFSNLMRKVLDASGQETISLQEELNILNLYLDLEKLRFRDDFTYEIHIEEEIDPYDIHLPSMILQPFVENAIKHGLLHKKGVKKLSIDFTLTDQLVCTITDNGIGRKHAAEIKERQSSKNASFATEATEKRIELLNSYTNVNYTFNIVDLYENGKATGTTVIIKLPL